MGAHGQAGENQGQHSGQSRTPVSSHQAPFRARQVALTGADEKLGAAAHAVCTLKSVDGLAQVFAQGAGMGAPAASPSAGMRREDVKKLTAYGSKFVKTGTAVTCREVRALSGYRCASVEHRPWRLFESGRV